MMTSSTTNDDRTTDIMEQLAAMTDRLMQADEARWAAHHEARESCPGLERKTTLLGRQIQASKQLMGEKQTKINDLNGMSVCAEKCFLFWNKNQISKIDAASKLQQELAMEEARLKENCATKEEMDRRIQSMQAAVATAEQHYRTLVDHKYQFLMKSCPAAIAILYNIQDRQRQLRIDVGQTQKTQAAAERALSSLRKASSHLDSARNWGHVDMMGGGTVVSVIKHGQMNEANAAFAQATRHMQLLQHECKEIDSLMRQGRTVDVWFDNIFSDIAVQSRIAQAAQQCNAAMAKISQIVSDCRQKVATDQRELNACELKYTTTIISYGKQ
jgi:hypothetical protein